MHAGVSEKSLHISTRCSEIKDVITVVRFDAVNVPKEFVGFLFHHRLLRFCGVAQTWCRRRHKELFSSTAEKRSRKPAREFHGAHHYSGDVDLSNGLHFAQRTE